MLEPGTFLYEAWTARWGLMNGLRVTVTTSLITIMIATFAGMLIGVMLTYGWKPLRWLARFYVDFVRGIPVLVLILFTYYGLALFKINITPFWAGALALSAYAAAHVAETVRGAVQSIPAGQMEAAKAIGLRFGQRLRYVIMPQAVRRMLPPLINTCVEAVKNTTLLSVIGVVELLLATQQAIARNYMVIDFYLMATLLYLAVNFSVSRLGALLERRFSYLRY